MIRSTIYACLLVSAWLIAGCAGQIVVEEPTGYSLQDPIYKESLDIGVSLLGVADKGEQGTLVEDPGWREYYLAIKNLGQQEVLIENVKLLNQQGRYVDSAATYAQITVPPSAGTGIAGDVAETAAGIAVGQVIPYGGAILGIFTDAASASSKKAQARADMAFLTRLLKNVELAEDGTVTGSAYLPKVTNPQVLVIDYVMEEKTHRIEIPLPVEY